MDKKVSLPLIDICAWLLRKTQFTPGMSRTSSKNCYFGEKKILGEEKLSTYRNERNIFGRRNFRCERTEV